VSDEAKAALEGASAPPIRKIVLGTTRPVDVGEETVLFRHEGRFFNPTAVAVTVDDTLEGDALKDRLDKINALKFTRVGQDIQVDGICVMNASGAAEPFAAAAKAAADSGDLSLILSSSSADNLKAAAQAVADRKPALHGATADNAEAVAAVGKELGCPVIVQSADLAVVEELTEKVKAAGVADMLIDVTAGSLLDTVENLTTTRRAALKKNFRPLGYPPVTFCLQEDPYEQTISASTFMAKYAGLVVVSGAEPWQILPLLTVRTNLYTDPQKPVQVEPKLYEIREPGDNAPVMFTTNFSLTYYSVEGEVEASRVPAYILAVDTEGTSVLTAYSGDKLTEEGVAKAMAACGIADKVKHRKPIIPGHVAVLSGKIEQETGWEVLVGPKEAANLPTYLKSVWSA